MTLSRDAATQCLSSASASMQARFSSLHCQGLAGRPGHVADGRSAGALPPEFDDLVNWSIRNRIHRTARSIRSLVDRSETMMGLVEHGNAVGPLFQDEQLRVPLHASPASHAMSSEPHGTAYNRRLLPHSVENESRYSQIAVVRARSNGSPDKASVPRSALAEDRLDGGGLVLDAITARSHRAWLDRKHGRWDHLYNPTKK